MRTRVTNIDDDLLPLTGRKCASGRVKEDKQVAARGCPSDIALMFLRQRQSDGAAIAELLVLAVGVGINTGRTDNQSWPRSWRR